jgi:hypothetical protein
VLALLARFAANVRLVGMGLVGRKEALNIADINSLEPLWRRVAFEALGRGGVEYLTVFHWPSPAMTGRHTPKAPFRKEFHNVCSKCPCLLGFLSLSVSLHIETGSSEEGGGRPRGGKNHWGPARTTGSLT